MHELLSDTKTVFLGLLAVLMALITWIGKRQVKRIDDLEAYAVRKAELAQLREDIRRDRSDMHEENRWKLDKIETGISNLTQRIDQLMDRPR